MFLSGRRYSSHTNDIATCVMIPHPAPENSVHFERGVLHSSSHDKRFMTCGVE